MKKEKGITLVALVITIVVLLILAGVAITALTGDNNIIGKAKEAKEKTGQVQENDLITIEQYEKFIDDNLEKTIMEAGVTFSGYYTEFSTSGGVPIEESLVSEPVTLTWEELKNGKDEEKYFYDSSAISDSCIGDYAFCDCGTPLTNIIIPNSVTSIGKEAFEGCKSLKNITIPNSVVSIGSMAFFECRGITNITIPSSVTSIDDDGVFGYCENLTSINVDENNTKYSSQDGILYSKDGTKLIIYPAGKKATSYEIPSNVTSIGDCAFESCSNLTNIIIPNGVTSIGGYAFAACSNLESITIPNSVINIEDYIFEDCSCLTTIIYNGKTYTSKSEFKADFAGTLDENSLTGETSLLN